MVGQNSQLGQEPLRANEVNKVYEAYQALDDVIALLPQHGATSAGVEIDTAELLPMISKAMLLLNEILTSHGL